MTLAVVLCFFSSLSIASTQIVGNGGHGIKDKGQIYAFDLYQYGLETVAFHAGLEPESDILKSIEKSMPEIDAKTQWLLASKIEEIRLLNSSFASSLLKAIAFYKWSFSEKRLLRVRDENLSGPNPYSEKLIQLAVRTHYNIIIDRSYYSQMDSLNKVALLVHESALAMIKPQISDSGLYYYQDSSRVRQIVATLFSVNRTPESLKDLTSGYFPSRISPVKYDNKHFLILDTKLAILVNSVTYTELELPRTGAELKSILELKAAEAETKEISVVGRLEAYSFQPQVYEGRTHETHWYLGYTYIEKSQVGPSLKILKNKAGTLLPLEKSGVVFDNLCGDNLTLTIDSASEGNLDHAINCLSDWIKEPSKYFENYGFKIEIRE